MTFKEDTFEHQIKLILEEFKDDYISEQEENEKDGQDPIITFDEYLWRNRTELGEKFYDRIDQYIGIEEITEPYNYEQHHI